VVLGDRPIELTLRRAWAALGPEERGVVLLACVSLVLGLRLRDGKGLEGLLPPRGGSSGEREGDVTSPSQPQSQKPPLPLFSPSLASGAEEGLGVGLELELEGYRGADDALLASLERFGQLFPELFEALIGERDRFLAWACKRSKAVNGAASGGRTRVVAVMGALHLPGVVKAIREDNGGNTLSFPKVARLPPPPALEEPEGAKRGGVVLSPAYRQLLGRAAAAWALQSLPRFVRDVAVGTVVLEGAKLGWGEAAPQLELWWAEVLGAAATLPGPPPSLPPF
jgi:hypothetical protein